MTFHHIGCLVKNLEEAIHNYKILFSSQYDSSKIYEIEELAIRVCFVKLKDDSFVELVEPTENNPSLLSMLNKRKFNFYHLAFRVKDVKGEVKRLESEGYRILSTFPSVAFDNKQCVFLSNSIQHLIELIEL